MMEKLRIGANSLPVKIIFGLIILGFIFTGVGGFLGFGSSGIDEQRMYIAKVDGEGISRQAFEREVQIALNKYPVDLQTTLQKQIRTQMFNMLLADQLRFDLAQMLDVKVSDESAKDIIRKNKTFFVDGKFNNERYLSILAENGITPGIYAQAIKSSEIKSKLLEFLIGSDFILPNELTTFNQFQEQQRTVYIGSISASDAVDLDAINISEEEEKAYYNEHKDNFMRSERVKMKYIVNSYTSILANTKQLTDEEIRSEYNNNALKYTIPEKRQYSIISSNSLDESKKIYKQLSKNSNDSHFQDIGWFSDGDLPDFLHNVNLKKVDQYSSPISVDGQYIIVKLTGLDKTKKMPFDFAKPLIAHAVFQDRVESKFDNINNLLEKASQDKSLTMEQISEQTGLPIVESNEWIDADKHDSILKKQELNDIVFSDLMVKNKEATDNISDVIYTDNGKANYIIQVLDYKDAGLADFDESKSSIVSILQKEKADAEFSPVVDDILKNFKEKDFDPRVKLSEQVTLNRDNDKLSSELVDNIFALVPPLQNDSAYGVDITSDGNATFFALINVSSPNDNEDFSNQLISSLFQNENFYLINYLRSQADIEIMPDVNP